MQLSRPLQKYKKSEIYKIFDDPKSLVDINILTGLRDELEANKQEYINYMTSISTWTKTYEIYLENVKIRTHQLMHINNEKMRAVRIKEFQSKNINIVDKFEVEENNAAEQQFIKELIAQLEEELNIQIQRSRVEEEAKMKREDLERRLKKAEQMIAQLPLEQLYSNELKYIFSRSLQPKTADRVVGMLVNKITLDQCEKGVKKYAEKLQELDQKAFELQKRVNQIRHMIFSLQQDNSVKAQQIEHMNNIHAQMMRHHDKLARQLKHMEEQFNLEREAVAKDDRTRIVKEPQRPWRRKEKSYDGKEVLGKLTSELNNILAGYQKRLIDISRSVNRLNLEVSKKFEKAEKDPDFFIAYVVKNDQILEQLLYIIENVRETNRGVFLTQETEQLDSIKRSLHSVEIGCFEKYLNKTKQKKNTKMKNYVIDDDIKFDVASQLSISDIK